MMAADSPRSALSLLAQLKNIIQEQEQTIFTQSEKIKELEEENAVLRSQQQNNANDLEGSQDLTSRSSTTVENPPTSPVTEERKLVQEENLSSIVKRSSSFQRKHLEEQDVRTRTESYELSSDLFDKQIEALRKFYGGADNCERAARIIQEAYRAYRMKLNFRKIRKSKTRRLTLENKLILTEPKEDDNNSKVEVVELVLEHPFNENENDKNVEDNPNSETNLNNDEEEEIFDKLFSNNNTSKERESDEPVTPKATDNEIEDVLSQISMPGIIADVESVKRRRKRKGHGYETIVLPNRKSESGKKEEDKNGGDDGTLKRGDDTSLLRHSIATSSIRSRNSDTDNTSEYNAWQRVGSELSLVSYDNEADEESLRSSDTASIASGQSEFSNNVIAETYQRRSTLSTRGSWHIDSNNDIMRKRLYRIGLNLFNKKPEKGIEFLVEHKFIARTAPAVATFLLNRKGLSRQMVGEYLGNTQKRFNQDVLDSVCELMDFSGQEIDEALRDFQRQIKVQGEAQKVDKLVETFSQRYCVCNPKLAESLKNADAIFILAFAIIMLNTDLHSPNMKREKRMTEDDFIKNLRGVDGGDDLNETMLRNTYHRIRDEELKTDDDHVTQVLNVEKNIIGKKPVLAVPHRRLVCYCRLYQVADPAKPQKVGLHQRAVFLFNDLLLITKVLQRKKNSSTYGFKLSLPLQGMNVLLFETTYYLFGIRLINTMDNKVLVTFNAPNEDDRNKFVTDLKESINEVQQMETYRIGAELERAQLPVDNRNNSLSRDNKLLSASMHNLNETSAPHAAVSQFLGNDRPTSMYTTTQNVNKNNNNFSNNTTNTLIQNSNHSSSPDLRSAGSHHKKESVLNSVFKFGKKSIMSPQSPEYAKDSIQSNDKPRITLTLSEV
ncbi:uncharacterized protein LOC120336967 [Styela clava]|uniref:IQ motif and SEC7 domain-containing protein 1-like n=1 Tax=Styela clava TaxID=7725 RepID=UPI00193AD837|nr:IQ motif and SEC7 domain-containing protein 1-like [Styela clava]